MPLDIPRMPSYVLEDIIQELRGIRKALERQVELAETHAKTVELMAANEAKRLEGANGSLEALRAFQQSMETSGSQLSSFVSVVAQRAQDKLGQEEAPIVPQPPCSKCGALFADGSCICEVSK